MFPIRESGYDMFHNEKNQPLCDMQEYRQVGPDQSVATLGLPIAYCGCKNMKAFNFFL